MGRHAPSKAVRRPYQGLTVEEFPRTSGSRHTAIIHFPGILTRGADSLMGLSGDTADPSSVLGYLRTRGNVLCVSYVGTSAWSGEMAAEAGRALIEQTLQRYKRVVVIGSSLGGLVAADALMRLHPAVRRRVDRLVLVDSPYGATSLGQGGVVGSWLFRLTRLHHLPWLRNLPMVGGPPKREEIERGLDPEAVIATAMARMQGFTIGEWGDQLASMTRHPELDPTMRVEYLHCDTGNVTVLPSAVRRWRAASLHVTVHSVRSPHCGYLQQPAAFIAALTTALG